MNKKNMTLLMRITIVMLLLFSQINLENANLFASSLDNETSNTAKNEVNNVKEETSTNKNQTENVTENKNERGEVFADTALLSVFSVTSSSSTELLSGESGTALVTIQTNSTTDHVIESPVLEIRIPTDNVSSVSAPDLVAQTSKTIRKIGGEYVVTYTLSNISAGQSLQIPVTFTTIRGVAPDDTTLPITAKLVDNSDGMEYFANDNKPLEYNINSNNPAVQKAIYSNGSSILQDNRSYFGGLPDANDSTKLSSNLNELVNIAFTYQFTDINYYLKNGARYHEKMIIKDVLPPNAYFDPALNPGWVYDSGTNTVTYELLGKDGQVLTGSSVSKGPDLILKFPGQTIDETINNNMEFEFVPQNRGNSELNYTTSDDLNFLLNAKITHGVLSKSAGIYDTDGTMLFAKSNNVPNMEAVWNAEIVWNISLTNPDSMKSPMENIVLRDYNMDARLKYTKVVIPQYYSSLVYPKPTESVLTNGGVSVYVLTTSDQKILIENNIDASTEAKTVLIPDNLNVKEVIVETDAGTELTIGKQMNVHVYARYINSNVDPLTTGAATHYNEAGFTGEYTEYNTQTFGDYRTSFRLVDYAPTISINKKINESGKVYVAGDQIPYVISLVSREFVGKQIVEYDKVIDLIPAGFEYVPNSSYGTANKTNVEPEIVNNYKNTGQTALIWTLDQQTFVADVFSMNSHSIFYKLKATSTAKEGANANQAYVLWENPNVVKPLAGTNSQVVSDTLDMNDNGDLSEQFVKAEVSTPFVLAKELITTKSVKGSKDSIFMTSPALGTGEPDSIVQYQLSVNNNSIQPVEYLTIIDTLPKVGDTTISSDINGKFSQRNSEFPITLAGPVVLPSGREAAFDVYYSTKEFANSPDTYVNDASWTQTVTDYSQVKSIKIVMKAGERIELAESLDFYISAQMPDIRFAAPDKIAVNSYGTSINSNQTSFFESNLVKVGTAKSDVGAVELLIRDKNSLNPIPGAQYNLVDSNNNIIGTYTTDAEGKIFVKDLIPRDYSFVEISVPDGYTVDSTPITKEVIAGEITEYLVEKELDKGNLVITTTDKDSNQPIPGAVYEVKDKEGNVIGTYTTDADGKITLPDLPTGDYTITEVSVPEGYTVDSTPRVTEVKKSETAQEDFIKELDKGNLVITTTDKDSNQPIPGAVYEVKDKDGNVIGTYTTDADGKITLPDLPTGDYTITEVSVPEGYTVDSTPRVTEVKKSETAQEDFIKELDKGNLAITVTDRDTKEPIPGAVYEVKDKDGNVIGVYTTDVNGQINVTGLLPGEYTVTEIFVPAGYTAENYIVQSEVVKNETAVILLDYKKPEEDLEGLPDTSNTTDTLVQTGEENLIVVAFIIIFFSSILLFLQRKLKKVFDIR